MQTKDFPSVIAVKKSTQPLIEQYKNMMDTEQKTNMPQISKQIIKDVIQTLDSYGCGAHHPDLLPLLAQPEPLAKLPAWRGICHPEGTRHLTQNICMNAHQLRNALDFVNPDGAKDIDQLESELTIQWRKEAVFEGENYPAGLYANFTDYPEEGSILLDADKSRITHPAPFTPITADDVTDGMIHDWHANTFGTQSMGVTDRDMIAAAVNAWGAKK